MSLQRIKTIILYSWYHLNHSLETWVDLLWFPVIQVLVFGLLTLFIESSGNSDIAKMVIFGLISWQIVMVVQYSINVGMMWDIWSRNFSTMFISPLNMREFVIGQAFFGMVKAFSISLLLFAVAWYFYGFSVLKLGLLAIPHFLLLSLFAISAGIFVAALILRFGTTIQSLSWSLIYLFQPISAVLYPVKVLPESIRWIAYLSPITYAMEVARDKLLMNVINWQYLLFALVLDVIYLIAAVLFLKKIKKWAHKSGAFARMEG